MPDCPVNPRVKPDEGNDKKERGHNISPPGPRPRIMFPWPSAPKDFCCARQ